ncbi:3022_t:CDS:2 [Funneliformis geosporum]|uniref:19770_t:CDS:1 n=1 Tax=Funneliformis geosporum TaxID=1117311 RepID=A0A9W4SJL0_9GLOM|nr:3022_t:CDS:2 [Funneliformis geosporum]CAI2170812.1 19770_t:CDS:2 [Funneliformis geosporum]
MKAQTVIMPRFYTTIVKIDIFLRKKNVAILEALYKRCAAAIRKRKQKGQKGADILLPVKLSEQDLKLKYPHISFYWQLASSELEKDFPDWRSKDNADTSYIDA